MARWDLVGPQLEEDIGALSCFPGMMILGSSHQANSYSMRFQRKKSRMSRVLACAELQKI